MGKRYQASGWVIIAKEVTVEFEDDEKFDLEDQAIEALRDSDEIPLSMSHDIDEITDLIIKEL